MILSQVTTATMLFLQFVLYASSFVDTLKNEIPEAPLEVSQLEIEQLSPGIFKLSTNHEDNPFTLNSFMVSRTFCFYFMQARVDWVLRIFGTRNDQFGPCFQTIISFLVTMVLLNIACNQNCKFGVFLINYGNNVT